MQDFIYNLQTNPKTKRILGISLIIVILVIIFITSITLINKLGKIKVDIKYAPFISTVKVNGKKVKNNAINYLEPGIYTLTAELENFTTISKEITINEDSTAFYGELVAENDAGQATASKYQNDFYIVESFAESESVKTGENEVKKYPIISNLPYNIPLYSIGYKLEDNLTLTITSTDEYIDTAIKKLISIGSIDEVIKYSLQINDFKNQLSSPTNSSNIKPEEFLESSFGNIENSFTISQGKTDGSYYYTTIIVKTASGQDEITYRVVLEKNNNSWSFATTPYPLLTTKNSPDVPEEIIKLVDLL